VPTIHFVPLLAPSSASPLLFFPLPSHLPPPLSWLLLLPPLSFPSPSLPPLLSCLPLLPPLPLPHSFLSTPYFFYPSYVLLHHVMGELEGARNAWAYVEGGMGSVSMAIARAAESYGATLHTESVSHHLDLLSKVHRAHHGRLSDSLHIAPLQNVYVCMECGCWLCF